MATKKNARGTKAKQPTKPRQPKPKGRQTQQKTLHYKRATFVPPLTGGQSLSEILKRALGTANRPTARMEHLNASPNTVRLINKCYEESSMLCGRFLDYTEGGATAVLEIDDEADELTIKEMLPEQRQQYLEGILTFGVLEDHLVLVQAKALKVGHLENHLNWLLVQKTGVMPNGTRLVLADEPTRHLKRKIANVSSVVLSERLPGARLLSDKKANKRAGLDTVIAGLQAMLPSVEDLFGKKLSPAQALALEELDVSLKISRKRRKGARSILDDVAHVLRHVDGDVDVVVKAAGTEFHSDELKLAVTRAIETEPGGLLKLKSAVAVMRQWLADLLTEDRIAG